MLSKIFDSNNANHPQRSSLISQINLGDKANSKPIFISESLSLSEKEDLISLVQDYIDVFT